MEEEARKAPTKYRYKMMNSVKHYRQEADRISYQLTSMVYCDLFISKIL